MDAMLGTGVRGRLRRPTSTVVHMINDSGKPVVAVDAPTGIDPATGEVHGVAVRASCTVTFHKRKPGLELAREYVGRLRVADIGVPTEAELYVGPGDVYKVVAPLRRARDRAAFRVLVVADARHSARLATDVAECSVALGADLVKVVAPSYVMREIRPQSAAVELEPLEGAEITAAHLPKLTDLAVISDATILCVSGGGRFEKDVVAEFTEGIRIPAVLVALSSDLPREVVSALSAAEILLACRDDLAAALLSVKPTPGLESLMDRTLKLAQELRVTAVNGLERGTLVVSDGVRVKAGHRVNRRLGLARHLALISGIAGKYLALRATRMDAATAATFLLHLACQLAEETRTHPSVSDMIHELQTAEDMCAGEISAYEGRGPRPKGD